MRYRKRYVAPWFLYRLSDIVEERKTMKKQLDKIFHLSDNNTNIRTEIVAGITTFMNMSYILAVNLSLLSETGQD